MTKVLLCDWGCWNDIPFASCGIFILIDTTGNLWITVIYLQFCHSLDSNQLTWNLPGCLKGQKLWGTVRALFSSNACSRCGLNLPLCSLDFHVYMWTMTSKDGVSFQLHPSAQIEGSIIFSIQFSSYYSVSQNCLGHACPQHKMLCHHCCVLVCLFLAFALAVVRQLAWRTPAESPEATREQRCDCKSRSVDTLTNCR